MVGGVTGGGRVPPLTFFIWKVLLVYRENRGKEKGKWRRKEGKLWKGSWETKKWKGKKYETFFFFAFHFSKALKFVWDVTCTKMENFYPEKAYRQEKLGKSYFAPLWKKFLLRHWQWQYKSGQWSISLPPLQLEGLPHPTWHPSQQKKRANIAELAIFGNHWTRVSRVLEPGNKITEGMDTSYSFLYKVSSRAWPRL